MARVLLRLVLLLCVAYHFQCCTYDEQSGTALACATAPLPATAGSAADAPGGVVNQGGTGQPAVFAVLSDWGGQGVPPYSTAGQVAAASAMNTVCAAAPCKAVLSAGNNVLPAGLPAGAEAAKARLNDTWSAVYGRGPALALPWYITGGFRDWEGNVSAERAFSGSASSGMTWHYPQLWQSVQLIVPPAYSTLQVLLLDTVTLLGSMGGDKAISRRRLLDFNSADEAPPVSDEQRSWLETELMASTADWLVVLGNDPLWSAGAAGPSALLTQWLLPLLNRAGVALYIGGRDPVAQHFKPTAAAPSLDVLVLGNGAAGNASQAASLPNAGRCPEGALAWSYGASAGFATLSFAMADSGDSNATLTVSFWGEEPSAALYSFTKAATRAGKQAGAPAPAGKHGSDSGLLLLMLLGGGTAAAGGYWVRAWLAGRAATDAEEEVPKRKARSERTPLVAAAADAPKQFNTFSL